MEANDGNSTIQPPVADVVVVMVPFIVHSHLNQLLHLSHLISNYQIPVHYISFATHIRQLHSRLRNSGPNSAASNLIHFHEFPTPSITSPPPNPSNRFPSHLQPAADSSLHLRHPVTDLILSLSRTTRRVAVVHDALMSYVVQDVKSIPNSATYIFNPVSAFDTFWRVWERRNRPFPVDPGMLKRVLYTDGCFSPEFIDFMKLQRTAQDGSHAGELIDSSRTIEAEYVEYLHREDMIGRKKLWALGPLNLVNKSTSTISKNRNRYLQWLDLQPPSSVVYVSFGTTTTFTDEQITELAIGLERSGNRFIWVLSKADKGDLFGEDTKMADLLDGFEERVEERGVVVVGEWAPQTKILGHVATSGFMTHCGWNSSTEGISKGVPMATWPIHSDQPRNAFLITDVLRIGLVMNDWEHRDELVKSVVVEDVVRRLMDSKEGEEVRKRAVELAETVRMSVAEGGECSKEIESFISHIRGRHG